MRKIQEIYRTLENHFGDLKWWPAETAFEVIAGAVLTQNTSWTNASKAVLVLKKKKLLDPAKIVKLKTSQLAKHITSAGYYNLKADGLKAISGFLMDECGGNLELLRRNCRKNYLRKKLLEVKGIGPETADSILLYALYKPIFVVDAYTKRIFSRHKIISENASYEETQKIVRENFQNSVKALNQFHALLVETAKQFCVKKNPKCSICPLGKARNV